MTVTNRTRDKGLRPNFLSRSWFPLYTSSSTEGNQKDIELQADAIIMYLGLNWKKDDYKKVCFKEFLEQAF